MAETGCHQNIYPTLPHLCLPLHRPDSQIPPILPLPTDKDDQINQLSPTSCNTTLHICIQTSWWPCLYRPYPRKPCPDHRPSPEDPKFPRPDCVSCCQTSTLPNRSLRCSVRPYLLPSILCPLQNPRPPP